MKTVNKILTFVLMTTVVFSFYSCKDKMIDTYNFIGNKPLYMSYDDMRSAVKSVDSVELKNTGKMYFYNGKVFINEYLKGIHIIDNTDPSNPKNIKFIQIPGNIDMLIKNDLMYADSYIDLVVLDISDIENIEEVNRVKDVFPYQLPAYDENYPLATIDETLGVVIGYTIEEVKESYDRTGLVNVMPFGFYKQEVAMVDATFDSGGGLGTGIAGSMARFSIYENNIYLLNETILNVYDISSPINPTYLTELNTFTIAETLFLYETNLFMGTQTGMRVYSLSNPSAPVFISEFSHIQSCDPVVVEDGYAYVTLRSGSNCGGFTNQLDVVDIKVITSPQLVKSYPMNNPHGLGIHNKTLFICDGEAGLKVYDATDPVRIDEHLLYHFPNMNAFDVIPMGNLIMMIGEDGLYQYNFEGGVMTQLSFIPIGD